MTAEVVKGHLEALLLATLEAGPAMAMPSSTPSGPPVSAASVLRIQAPELTPGLVDAVAVIRRGQRAVFIALRPEAVPGR